MTLDQKRALIAQPVTLNGNAAVISGAKEQFAVVRDLHHHERQATFSWQTVARVVASGGVFKV